MTCIYFGQTYVVGGFIYYLTPTKANIMLCGDIVPIILQQLTLL